MKRSILTACCGREDDLLTSLLSWVECDVDEIVIVDFNHKPVIEERLRLENIEDQRTVIVDATDHNFGWVLSWAYNIGLAVVTGDLTLKLDCDDKVEPALFDQFLQECIHTYKREKDENCFFAGDWRLEDALTNATSSGVLIAKTSVLRLIGGYNSNILTYGWDDIDLHFRLKSAGFSMKLVWPGITQRRRHDKILRHSKQIRANSAELKWMINNGLRDMSCQINLHICNELYSKGYTLPNIELITLNSYDVNKSAVKSRLIAIAEHARSWLERVSWIDLILSQKWDSEKRDYVRLSIARSKYYLLLKNYYCKADNTVYLNEFSQSNEIDKPE